LPVKRTEDEVTEGREAAPESNGCLPVLLRLTWMIWGNAALFLCVVFVALGTAPVVADLMVLAMAGFLVVVRYVDIHLFKGETADGEPATLAHWRRYAMAVAFLAAALWATARIVAFRGWIGIASTSL
jgi:hypothetical protein